MESSQKVQVELCEVSEKLSGSPHEALFLVLSYLPLLELLVISEVCRSLKEAINDDILPWLNIIVRKPLSSRISNDVLMRITSKANGNLRTLALISCFRITDDGLLAVIANNPRINKLHLPGCTGLTPEGVITAVKMLTVKNCNLTSLVINGIYDVQKEHLNTLISLTRTNVNQSNRKEETVCSIDVDICPNCNEVRLVLDCPRETCERKRLKKLTECRGCQICIPRCEECRICVEFEEQGDAACADLLCIGCWFRLPKCNHCNKPCCSQHVDQQHTASGSSGYVCDDCWFMVHWSLSSEG